MDFSIGNIKHYLHPNLARNLYSYTKTNETYIIKKYHGCTCSLATSNPCWRKTKNKYKHKGKIYLTKNTVRELKQLKVSVTNFQ